MTEMNSIEIAQGNYGTGEVLILPVDVAYDLHRL